MALGLFVVMFTLAQPDEAFAQNTPAVTSPGHQTPASGFSAMVGPPPAGPEAAYRRIIDGYPYWEAGILDKKLSTSCSLGEFNQVVRNKGTIGFNGIRRMPMIGAAVLGTATADWNLMDPKKQAEAGTTYYFHNDGTPECQVFRWKADEKRRKLGAQIYPAGSQRAYYDKLYDFVQ